MRKLFCVLALLITLNVSAQEAYEELYTATIDSVEYADAMVFADEIFQTEYNDAYVTWFQLYTDIWYERIQFKESDLVLYTKQIREESYGY